MSYSIENARAVLDEWATEYELTEDPVVADLLGDLGRDDNLSVWASTDFFAVLPMQPNSDASKTGGERGILRILSVLRGILFVLPIALTWLSIWQATDGFNRYKVGLEPEQRTTFLDYWTSEAAGTHRLQSTATLIVLIVAVIIVVSLLRELLASGRDRHKLKRHRVFNHHRAQVALALQAVVRPRQRVDVTGVGQALRTSLEGFTVAANSLRDSSVRLDDSLRGADGLGPRLQETSESLGRVVQMIDGNLAESVSKLTGQIERMSEASKGVNEKILQNVERTFSDVAAVLRDFKADLDRLRQEMSGSQDLMKRDLEGWLRSLEVSKVRIAEEMARWHQVLEASQVRMRGLFDDR